MKTYSMFYIIMIIHWSNFNDMHKYNYDMITYKKRMLCFTPGLNNIIKLDHS